VQDPFLENHVSDQLAEDGAGVGLLARVNGKSAM
jgi:hypothetical protein